MNLSRKKLCPNEKNNQDFFFFIFLIANIKFVSLKIQTTYTYLSVSYTKPPLHNL